MSFIWMERGTHRVQRKPPTEARGRTHTSIINVIVTSAHEDKEITIDKSKVKISYYKDSGRGGQHRNKTMSGVRLQYEDYTIECCDTRDQRKNKEIAYQRLHEKILLHQNNIAQTSYRKEHEKQNSQKGKRGSYERTYNFNRNQIIQNGHKYDLKKFIKGNLDELYG